MVIGLLILASISILRLSKESLNSGKYLLPVTAGTIAFFVFKTGLAATHFVLGLPLLYLCKKFFTKKTWYFIVSLWTITSLIPMYGALGYAIEPFKIMEPLQADNNIITQLFTSIFPSDITITIGSLTNLFLSIFLVYKMLKEKT